MLKINNIVRSKKHKKVVINYKIIEINGDKAKCLRLDDEYEYTIPLEDLYIPRVVK